MLLFLLCLCVKEGERVVSFNITIICLPPGGLADDPQPCEFGLSLLVSVSSVVVFCNLGFSFLERDGGRDDFACDEALGGRLCLM